MIKVSLDCSWDTPENLLRRYLIFTPKLSGTWNGLKCVSSIEESDVVVCLGDKTNRDYGGRSFIQLRREPDFVQRFHPHKKASYVLDYHGKGYHAVTYHLESSYDELSALLYPVKDAKKEISLISSNKWAHRNKHISKLAKSNVGGSISFFGRGLSSVVGEELYGGTLGFPETSCKSAGLLPFKYSIAIENSVQKNYFSEKLTDCYLTWTMPIYYGCPNVGEFFPEDSYILIDSIDTLDQQIEDILGREISKSDIDAMAHARDLVLNRYGLWPTVDRIIRENAV